MCSAKSVGLVRYPTEFGGSTAELSCADNAHSNSSSNMSAVCSSSGSWSDESSECVCNEFYRVKHENEEDTCEGKLVYFHYCKVFSTHNVLCMCVYSYSKLSSEE